MQHLDSARVSLCTTMRFTFVLSGLPYDILNAYVWTTCNFGLTGPRGILGVKISLLLAALTPQAFDLE